jgi:hypothetical protein
MTTTSPQATVAHSDTALNSPQFIADVIAAHESGIDVEDYLGARAHGTGDFELRAAFGASLPLEPYAAARAAGATAAELYLLAGEFPVGPASQRRPTRMAGTFTLYATARTHGVAHHEFVDAARNGIPLAAYVAARRHGATHAEVVEFNALEGYIYGYAIARDLGATHAGLIDAQGVAIGEVYYAEALASGITHVELMEIAALDQRLVCDYVLDRRAGYDHHSAMAIQRDYLTRSAIRYSGTN